MIPRNRMNASTSSDAHRRVLGRPGSNPPGSSSSATSASASTPADRQKKPPPPRAVPTVPAERVDIASVNDVIYLRVIGLGNAAKSVALRDVAESLLVRGCRRLLVDLGKARGLDSTFMGTLLALASTAMERLETDTTSTTSDPMREQGVMILVNVPANVRVQLDNLGLLGVEPLVVVHHQPIAFPECCMNPLPEITSSHTRRLDVIREAHERLIKLNPLNESRFGPFLHAMLAEMDQRRRDTPHSA